MLTAWKTVQDLIKDNAKHRKGFELQSVTTAEAIKHMREEIDELAESPDDMVEVLDIMAICIHLLVKAGWSCESAEKILIEKLHQRFSVDPAPRLIDRLPLPGHPRFRRTLEKNQAIEFDTGDNDWTPVSALLTGEELDTCVALAYFYFSMRPYAADGERAGLWALYLSQRNEKAEQQLSL